MRHCRAKRILKLPTNGLTGNDRNRLMQMKSEFGHIFESISRMELSGALDALKAFVSAHPELAVDSRLSEIDSEYSLMSDYWRRGFRDEQLERVYRNMLVRLYRLAADTCVRHELTHSSYLSVFYNRVRSGARDWSVASVRKHLEAFVADVAMLQLEPEPRQGGLKSELYRNHQQLMNDVFDYLWTSQQWTDSTAAAMAELLVSPTVDTNDQQLMVSAVMLGAMNMFDVNKFRLLVEVYRRATDEHVRQRALVGWVLTLGGYRYRLFPEVGETVASLLADGKAVKELVELQIQLLYCLSAETDNNTIQKEIMPELLRHNRLNITPNGIEEKDEDSIEEIIHPEAAERDMEKVERSFRKMMDMQKAGADIYFGGFSQMKRFPFFGSVSNWFVPFYAEHPAVSEVFRQLGDSKVVRNIISHVPFCDSDKYSFVFAFQQVAGRLPQNIRELLSSGNVMDMENIDAEERGTAAYVRRTYLQNLYRFFRLFPSRNLLYNPFETEQGKTVPNCLFFADRTFSGTKLESSLCEIASCLVSRNMEDAAWAVLGNCGAESRDYQYYVLKGSLLLRRHGLSGGAEADDAAGCFAEALRLRHDDVKALSGQARAMFYAGNYGGALAVYNRLIELKPESSGFVLNKCVCLVNLGRSEDALNDIYRLDYERPGDNRVGRVMARALMSVGQYDKASKVYAGLCASDACEDDDLANCGLNAWLSGDKMLAAERFADYLSRHYGSIGLDEGRRRFAEDILGKESELLSDRGVSPVETHLMSDLVCDLILRRM